MPDHKPYIHKPHSADVFKNSASVFRYGNQNDEYGVLQLNNDIPVQSGVKNWFDLPPSGYLQYT